MSLVHPNKAHVRRCLRLSVLDQHDAGSRLPVELCLLTATSLHQRRPDRNRCGVANISAPYENKNNRSTNSSQMGARKRTSHRAANWRGVIELQELQLIFSSSVRMQRRSAGFEQDAASHSKTET